MSSAPNSRSPLPEVRDNASLIAVLSKATADIAAGRPFTIAGKTPVAKIEIFPEPAPAPAPVADIATAPPPPPDVVPASPPPVVLTPVLVPPSAISSAGPTAPPPEKPVRTEAASTSIRVETSKLDRLMDMVGEMVIAQAILSNTRAGSTPDARLTGEMLKLARITSEVQRCAMSMRMMPIGPLFQKNAKMVRDLSRRNGK